MIARKIMPIIYWLVSSLEQPAWTVLEVGNKLCRSCINSSFHSLQVSDWWQCQCYRITFINNQHFQMRNPSLTSLSFWAHFVCTQTQQIKHALQIEAVINFFFFFFNFKTKNGNLHSHKIWGASEFTKSLKKQLLPAGLPRSAATQFRIKTQKQQLEHLEEHTEESTFMWVERV